MNNIYSKLRKIRKEKNLTLKEMSEKTGLSLSFLSQVERNKCDITLMSLAKITKALDIDINDLLKDNDIEGEVYHRKKEDFKLIETGHTSIKYEKISGNFTMKQIDSILVTCKSNYKTEYERHAGEEFFYVLEGQAVFIIDGEKYTVNKGETIHFPSEKKHILINPLNKEMKAVAVVTQLL